MVFLMLVLFVEVASTLFHELKLEKMETGIDGPVFDQGTFHALFLSRMGILIIAFLLVFIFIINPGALPGSSVHLWLLVTLVLIVAQEIAGRVLFYASYFRLGV